MLITRSYGKEAFLNSRIQLKACLVRGAPLPIYGGGSVVRDVQDAACDAASRLP